MTKKGPQIYVPMYLYSPCKALGAGLQALLVPGVLGLPARCAGGLARPGPLTLAMKGLNLDPLGGCICRIWGDLRGFERIPFTFSTAGHTERALHYSGPRFRRGALPLDHERLRERLFDFQMMSFFLYESRHVSIMVSKLLYSIFHEILYCMVLCRGYAVLYYTYYSVLKRLSRPIEV